MRTPGARRRIRTVLISVGVAAAAAVGLAALGLYIAPRVLPNIGATVAATDTEQMLTADGRSARLTVPAGWVASRVWGDDGELQLRSPDGVLVVDASLRSAPAAGAFAAEAENAAGAGDVLTRTANEPLASGLAVVHASAGSGLTIAAVGESDGAWSVVLHARAPADRTAEYRAALAQLVESVEVEP